MYSMKLFEVFDGIRGSNNNNNNNNGLLVLRMVALLY